MLLSEEKEKSISRILISGMLILAVCLTACMLHVADVRIAFEKEAQSNFSNQMFTSNQILSDELDKSFSNVAEAALKLGTEKGFPRDSDIFITLRKYQVNYKDIVYITTDGQLYLTNGSKFKGNEKYDVKEINKNQNAAITLKNYEIEERDQNQNQQNLVFIAPVKSNDKIVGHIIAKLDVSQILREKSYQYLSHMGYAMITNNKGKVIASSEGSEQIIKEKSNVFDGLIEMSYQSADSRLKLRTFQDGMLKKTNDTIKIMTRLGESLLISYQEVEGTKGIFLVCCYNESIAAQKIQPVIFRSALTCMVIIILMIIAILYVWASSKRANVTIEKMAYEDPVTKGKNLNYFKDRAVEIMLFNKEMPFLIQRFDIVNFRFINEAYGHSRADEILKGCIEVAEKCFLEKELCVRMDVDQFLVLSQNDGRSEQRREDYIRALNEYSRSIGVKYPIRLKFGIYQVRKTDTDINMMIDRANVARKSLTGEEKVLQAYYSDSIIKEMRKIDQIESEMQKALDTGEFKLYLQPKWDIEKDKLHGAEALARWIKPDKTMVMPDDFIPIFEKNGFIEKLDFYMLESVCRSMRELIDLKIPIVPISVNQSRVLLNSPDYTRNVAKILERYNIPKEYIELELTETVFMEDRETMINIMKELKKLEITISMDDFGSGYSSLNILKDIPFDVLKIDREFFSESVAVENNRWILQKVVEMAYGLGITVICEGVETQEQIQFLKEIGCNLVQGYYYDPPMQIDAFNSKYHGVKYELS